MVKIWDPFITHILVAKSVFTSVSIPPNSPITSGFSFTSFCGTWRSEKNTWERTTTKSRWWFQAICKNMSQIGSSPQVRIKQKHRNHWLTTLHHDCIHRLLAQKSVWASWDPFQRSSNSVQSQGTNEELLEELTGMYLVNGLFHPYYIGRWNLRPLQIGV